MIFKSRRKIRNFWLNSQFQGRYVRSLVASSFLAMLLYGLVFYKHIKENYDTLVNISPMSEEAKIQLYEELNHIIIYLSGSSLVFLLLVIFIGIIYSHRVAGPLFKIKSVCQEIINGNPAARISLRPNDEFQDVAEQLNNMIDKLQKNPK